MEMESSRRSIDRSREPSSLKKPRLVEEAERDRDLNGVIDRERPQARGDAVGSALLARFRANVRDKDATGVQQHQQQLRELVSQYKTALAELTFNSKPIITNLTIIAGENTHACKGITASVCQNILEVPSEQKLPSLYLLDSIVKNIGGDYVKYFAFRLPEVFCKAYRQVDPSVHPGMQHLFRTWRGVFPPAPLQIIEEELDFPPASISRSDSQSQRPAHSIHVNPKYLEARQHLQQSRRPKGIGTDSTTTTLTEDVEQPERSPIIGVPKPWTDLKMHAIQRPKSPQKEQLDEPVHEKKQSAGYGDYRSGSDCTRNSELGIGRGERITEREGVDKSWYGLECGITNAPVGQRNGYDMSQLDTHSPVLDSYGNYQTPKHASAATQLHPTQSNADSSNRGTDQNWKNSEEEEYLWDDVNSRLADDGANDCSRNDVWNPDGGEKRASLPRDKWMPLETNLPDTGWNVLDSASRLEKPAAGDDKISLHREVEDHLRLPRGQRDIGSSGTGETSTDTLLVGQGVQSAFGHRIVSAWPSREPNLPPRGDSLNHRIISSQSEGPSRTRLWPLVSPSFGAGPSSFGSLPHSILGSGGVFGHQWQQPQRPPSPSAQPSMHYSPHSLSSSQQPYALIDHDLQTSLIDHDLQTSQSLSQLGQKAFQQIGQFNQAPQNQVSEDFFPIMPQNNIQPGTLRSSQVSQSQPLQHFHSSPSSVTPLAHQRPPISSHQPTPELPLIQKPHPQPPNFGTSHTMGYSESVLLRNPGADISGQSKTDILADIFKNGLLPAQSSLDSNFPSLRSTSLNPGIPDSSMQSHMSIRPPLPIGPRPTQLTSGRSPSSPPLSAVQPPLPPGPPPASFMVGTNPSQISNPASVGPSHLSSLLSTLVAKGLISEPATEALTLTPPELPSRLQNQSTSSVTSTAMLASSSLPSSILPPSSEPSSKAAASSHQITPTDINDLIGIEFMPEIIRKFHPLVITSLFDDLPRQCSICGILRFKQREELDRHLNWHSSKMHGQSSGNKISRLWYSSLQDWVDANVGPSYGPVPGTSVEETATLVEKCEHVVPADESQSICALCGEPFEDFYCDERDEWMYKEAVYMTLPPGEGGLGSMDDESLQGPIVHMNCLSRDSFDELGVAGYGNLEKKGG